MPPAGSTHDAPGRSAPAWHFDERFVYDARAASPVGNAGELAGIAARGTDLETRTMTDAVLFDLNGVIVDDEDQHRLAFTEVLERFGLSLRREDYYDHFLGFDDRLCFAEAFRLANRTLPSELLRHLVAQKAAVYRDLIAERCEPVPGALEFVRAAARHSRLAIVSGALRDEIELILGRTGIRDQFETIVAAEDVLRCKPHPAGYRAALAALDKRQPVIADRCVAVEDSPAGVAAARAAALRCVALTTSVGEPALRDANAVWESFANHTPAELEAVPGP